MSIVVLATAVGLGREWEGRRERERERQTEDEEHSHYSCCPGSLSGAAGSVSRAGWSGEDPRRSWRSAEQSGTGLKGSSPSSISSWRTCPRSVLCYAIHLLLCMPGCAMSDGLDEDDAIITGQDSSPSIARTHARGCGGGKRSRMPPADRRDSLPRYIHRQEQQRQEICTDAEHYTVAHTLLHTTLVTHTHSLTPSLLRTPSPELPCTSSFRCSRLPCPQAVAAESPDSSRLSSSSSSTPASIYIACDRQR